MPIPSAWYAADRSSRTTCSRTRPSSANGGGAWLGYSMGGRIALHVALGHPDDVSRLVLVGATPGIVDPIDRATRCEADEALAAMVERVGVDAFLEQWLAQPLFAG